MDDGATLVPEPWYMTIWGMSFCMTLIAFLIAVGVVFVALAVQEIVSRRLWVSRARKADGRIIRHRDLGGHLPSRHLQNPGLNRACR